MENLTNRRNCLVSRGYSIKVADVAVCNPAYKKDYSEIGNRPPAPIRWLPWESILLVMIIKHNDSLLTIFSSWRKANFLIIPTYYYNYLAILVV